MSFGPSEVVSEDASVVLGLAYDCRCGPAGACALPAHHCGAFLQTEGML